MAQKVIKQAKDLDNNFRYEIAEKVGAKSLLKCIQCGVCSSGCTVTEYVDMQPHRVVASCLLGLKEEVLSSQAIWTCSLCHRCTERCPKNVDYSFILVLLRNMAVKCGKIPKEYSGSIVTIYNNGFAIPYTGGLKDNIDKRRNRLGLPQFTAPNLDEIRFIIEETGLGYLAKKEVDK